MSDLTGQPPRSEPSDGEGEVTVLGTAHVSEASVREVEERIAEDRPDVVAVELDQGRYRQMKGEQPDDLDASDLLRGNTVFQFLAYWMLSYIQTQLGDRFDIEPGADMMAAIDSAEEHGIDVALVDRDIQETIQRFWARMTLTEKLRMVGGLAFGVTDSRVVGIMVGLIVGLIAGPALALFGGAVGITEAVYLRAATAALLGLAAALLVDQVAGLAVGGDSRLAAALGSGGAVATVAAMTGAADALVGSLLGGFAVTIIGSLALGVTGGLAFGIVAAGLIGLRGPVEPEAGGIDEMDIEELTDADVVTVMMEEFRQFSPGGAEALIDERDAYIAHQLIGLRNAGYDVLAVVGAGHRAGIEGYLDDPSSLPPMESLTGTETGSGIPWGKIVGIGLSVGFVAFFVLLAMAGVQNGFLLRLFGAWFLINAVFAAGFAKLAGARWSSAGVGGAVAWMTSINPALAPGWFAGYAELRHLTVNVGDISTLNALLSDETKPLGEIVSEMFEVPLFKLIMVVALTNIGSIVASVLFVSYVLPLFGTELGGVDGVSRLMLEGARNSAELIWRTIT
ncbi:TraB/GumN family protein [Halonotius terrestris]|uniref:TraB/GumN family protein n=1 Tax=Halonotius terrestris TaxID=2487750 RepID=A0A8J8PC57_9EURY|nr:TraB/GumN family protein [Halonotius terrestris]TQQ81133.1 TraB/GumN family protein [Halonotius terrestris]